MSSNSELIEPLKKSGYTIEPDNHDPKGTLIVQIPIDVGEGVRTVQEVSMWEQLALTAFMQHYWSDNSVSVTIKFDPLTEADQLKHALNYYQYQLKSVSFLPKYSLDRDGKKTVYEQAPYEPIDEHTYLEMKKKLKPLFLHKMIGGKEAEGEVFCTSDRCVKI